MEHLRHFFPKIHLRDLEDFVFQICSIFYENLKYRRTPTANVPYPLLSAVGDNGKKF